MASARKWLGDGDIEASKAARTRAALEYDQANEDRASELAVGIYVVDIRNSKGTCLRMHVFTHSSSYSLWHFACHLHRNGIRNLRDLLQI